MKIFYLNDTAFHQGVYVDDLNSTPVRLNHGEGRVFEVKDRPDTIPFVKVWHTGQVLISLIDFKEEKPD